MATRPDSLPNKVTFVKKTLKSGVTINYGVGVKLSSGGETEVDVCGANDKVYGIAYGPLGSSATGDGTLQIEIALCCGGGVIPVKASGTATAFEYAICGTDGFENQTIGGGTTVKYLAGRFTQTGVDGDFVGLMLGNFAAGCA
jgi:hypothetical protein